MEQEVVAIIRRNIAHLMGIREIPSMNALSKQAKLADKTVSNLMADDVISNPTIKVVVSIAKVLKVEPWMLMIDDFPFDKVKGRPLRTMSGPTYVIADAMEHESKTTQLLMMESASQTLRGIDNKYSKLIKDAQANYLKNP